MQIDDLTPQVLAVEENHQLRRLIRVNLEADGLRVCEAQSHDECLRVMEAEKCNLLLVSLDVADQEAARIVHEVRRREGWALPVLLITRETPSSSLLREIAPAGHLRKPFDAAALTACVRDLLSGRACGDQAKRFCI
ncbi:MAG: response regulator [Chloroflexi bacterium]|nr:response regulator [Chloroflexota bacterium]